MKMPFFASFIIFLIWVSYEISRSRRRGEKARQTYWDRENAANSTRRKSLDGLNYITIPFDSLPMDILKDEERVSECHKTLHDLADFPIVNFTGLTNTDLKLEYGAPNIDLLMRYDQNYTTLVRTLQQWAQKLYDAGYIPETKQILEFAVSTGTDVSGSYRLLANIYAAEGENGKITKLMEQAKTLKSASRNIIVRTLQEFDS